MKNCLHCDADMRGLVQYNRRKYCSPACVVAWKQRPEVIAERFWAKVDKIGDCWTWQGARSSVTRYGMFSYHRHNIHAHRAAWILTYGPIGDSKIHVLHRCNNGHLACVRPEHLYLGGYKENTQDKVDAGRTRGVLTNEQVREVRRLLKTKSAIEVAAEFNVRRGVIWNIRSGKTFKMLADEVTA